jgi:hypothetical protein
VVIYEPAVLWMESYTVQIHERGQKDHLVSQDILGWVKDRGFIVTSKRLEWGIIYGNVEE